MKVDSAKSPSETLKPARRQAYKTLISAVSEQVARVESQTGTRRDAKRCQVTEKEALEGSGVETGGCVMAGEDEMVII